MKCTLLHNENYTDLFKQRTMVELQNLHDLSNEVRFK